MGRGLDGKRIRSRRDWKRELFCKFEHVTGDIRVDRSLYFWRPAKLKWLSLFNWLVDWFVLQLLLKRT